MEKRLKKKAGGSHSQVFCQIRDGLLEAIEFERNGVTYREPFNMGPDSSKKSPERFAKRPPEAIFISASSASRDAHGHRYGSELLKLDDVMLDKLRQGQQLAAEICQGEYVLFIQYRDKGLT